MDAGKPAEDQVAFSLRGMLYSDPSTPYECSHSLLVERSQLTFSIPWVINPPDRNLTNRRIRPRLGVPILSELAGLVIVVLTALLGLILTSRRTIHIL